MGEAKTTASEKQMQKLRNQQSTFVVWWHSCKMKTSVLWKSGKVQECEKNVENFSTCPTSDAIGGKGFDNNQPVGVVVSHKATLTFSIYFHVYLQLEKNLSDKKYKNNKHQHFSIQNKQKSFNILLRKKITTMTQKIDNNQPVWCSGITQGDANI